MKGVFAMHRPTLTVLPLMLFALAVAPGCGPQRIAEMDYSPDNPYRPGGDLYVSWEEQKRDRGLLEDSAVTHTAAGAGIGAVIGQAAGKDTEATVLGTAIGGGVGLISGIVDEDKKRIEHENKYTRLANQWQRNENKRQQAIRDVHQGAAITDAQIADQHQRLQKAREDLAERDRNAGRAREYRDIEREIEEIEGTVTSSDY